MDRPDGGMEKILAIEESINGMIDLHRLVSELKEMEIDQQRVIEDLQSNVNQVQDLPPKYSPETLYQEQGFIL